MSDSKLKKSMFPEISDETNTSKKWNMPSVLNEQTENNKIITEEPKEKKTSTFVDIMKIVLKILIILGACITTFIMAFLTLLSCNLAMNTFNDPAQPILNWFMVFLFGITTFVPFFSPLLFYYFYPVTWWCIKPEMQFLV